MKISIITVCFNSEATIENTLKSVGEQTYKDIEYIIIDGGSTDGTCGIIEQYLPYITTFVSEPDNGIYDAMNKGLDRATGDYVLFLGSDDRLMDKDVIKNVVNNISTNKGDVFYGDVYREVRKDYYCGKFNRYKLAVKNISHQAIFYPRFIYKKNRYNTDYSVFADYYYNIHLFCRFKYTYIGICVSVFNDNSTSNVAVDPAFEDIRRIHIVNNLGFAPLVYSDIYHFFRNMIRKTR